MAFGFLKDIVGGVGDLAKKASPFLSAIPGVGIPASMGVGALGGAMGTLNDENRGVRDFLQNAAGGGAMGAAGGLAQKAGIPGLLQKLGINPSAIPALLAGGGAVASGVGARNTANRANDVMERTMGTVRGQYDDRAPIRAAANRGLASRAGNMPSANFNTGPAGATLASRMGSMRGGPRPPNMFSRHMRQGQRQLPAAA